MKLCKIYSVLIKKCLAAKRNVAVEKAKRLYEICCNILYASKMLRDNTHDLLAIKYSSYAVYSQEYQGHREKI